MSISPAAHEVYISIKDKNTCAEKTWSWFEQLRPKYEPIFPFMLADALLGGLNGDSPIKREFKKLITELKKSPRTIVRPGYFYGDRLDWLALEMFETDEETAKEIIELKESAQLQGLCKEPAIELKLAKGYFYMKREKWLEALQIFDNAGQRVARMSFPGPWGCAQCPASALALADQCRKKLNIGTPRPGFHIEIEQPLFTSKEYPLLGTYQQELWVADADHLLQYRTDGELVKRHDFKAPMTLSAIAVVKEKIYLGTLGAGLLELDKKDLRMKRYTSAEGLLYDHITDLQIIGSKLWIGYGHRSAKGMEADEAAGRLGRTRFSVEAAGGTGFMDLESSQFTSFPFNPAQVENVEEWRRVPEFENEKGKFDQLPPNRPIVGISGAPDGSVYFAVERRGIQRLHADGKKWSTYRVTPASPVTSIAVSADYFCAGQNDREVSNLEQRKGPLWIRRAGDENFLQLGIKEGLPSEEVHSLYLTERTLWVGGFGYVAEMDLPDLLKIKRIFSVPAREVRKLFSDGKHLWLASEDRIFTVQI